MTQYGKLVSIFTSKSTLVSRISMFHLVTLANPFLTPTRYHTEQPYLISQYLSPENRDGDIQPPDSFLFNDASTPLAFRFKPGKRYLIRIVSASALACSQFHIEGHTLT